MSPDIEERTPAALKVFLTVAAALIVLGLACFLVWAFSPFDTSASTAPVSLSPDPGVPIPASSLMERAHSARIAS